jgi:hypothetical protein
MSKLKGILSLVATWNAPPLKIKIPTYCMAYAGMHTSAFQKRTFSQCSTLVLEYMLCSEAMSLVGHGNELLSLLSTDHT